MCLRGAELPVAIPQGQKTRNRKADRQQWPCSNVSWGEGLLSACLHTVSLQWWKGSELLKDIQKVETWKGALEATSWVNFKAGLGCTEPFPVQF